MLVPFTKMQGLGNDFIVVDALAGNADRPNPSWADGQWRQLAIAVCDRHFGIGADGLIPILPSTVAPFRMRIFNSDGSEAEMCGNGIRCFARYVFERDLTKSTDLDIETLAGTKTVSLDAVDGKVRSARVNMGVPSFGAAEIPVRAGVETMKDYPLAVAGRAYAISCISMGNPHAVVSLTEEEVNQLNLPAIGPLFEHHEIFPERTNTEFCAVLDRQTIRMRVWERGAGETLACGTGACASAVVAIDHGYVDTKVDVVLDGGRLTIQWDGAGQPVYMTGPAKYVCSGEYHFDL